MSAQNRFVAFALILQVLMAVVGHFSTAVLSLSGGLGTAIPFLVALFYGKSHGTTVGETTKAGFLIGAVGAGVGVLIAALLEDQAWSLMSFAPLASGMAGMLGALLGRGLLGGKRSNRSRSVS